MSGRLARVLRGALALAVPIVVLTIVAGRIAKPLTPEAAGPDVSQQMHQSFDGAERGGYDCLVLGNSRLYRGVNPDLLGIAAYNFAFTADSFNQSYYKLNHLVERGVRFNRLILGVDYFEFSLFIDSWNRFYGPYLGQAYLEDYLDASGSSRIADRVLHPVDEEAFNAWMMATFTRPVSVLLERAVAWLVGDPLPRRAVLYQKQNGQFVSDVNIAQPWDVVRRDVTRLPLQVRYFRATLDLARRHGIDAVVVMLPVREAERRSYRDGELEEAEAWLTQTARDAGVPYLNYASDPRFTVGDFADITHLNEAGADKFSLVLGRDLVQRGVIARQQVVEKPDHLK